MYEFVCTGCNASMLRRLDAMSKLGSMRICILAIFSYFKDMTLVSPDAMKVVSEILTLLLVPLNST